VIRRLGVIVACCIGLTLGSSAAVAGAAPGGSAGHTCAGLKKEMGITAFKLFYGDASGNHAMANCKAQHS
jgi:hypothetical protein